MQLRFPWDWCHRFGLSSTVVAEMSTTMFRTTVVRSIPRSLQALHAAPARSPLCGHVLKASLRTLARPGKASGLLSLALRHPHQTALVRHATNAASYDWKKAEEALQKETLKPSVAAAPQAAIGSAEESSDDVDMMAGIRGDFVSDLGQRFSGWS